MKSRKDKNILLEQPEIKSLRYQFGYFEHREFKP